MNQIDKLKERNKIRNTKALLQINAITWPHEKASTEREPFAVTLHGGVEVTLAIPLAAAVELEERGCVIRAGFAPSFTGFALTITN